MIYTHGLDRSINHIMIYDGNTPVAVVKLWFWYTNIVKIHPDEYDEAGWISKVEHILLNYADKYELNVKQLSAKPIKILDVLDLQHD